MWQPTEWWLQFAPSASEKNRTKKNKSAAALTIFTEKVFQKRNAVNNSVLKFFEIDWVTSGLQNAAETRSVHSVLCGRVNDEVIVEQSTLWDIYDTRQRTRVY